ncbi:hypothetical protein [Sphaerospermopsis sp. FACHB-1194]|uniref:hypothetical protein n=1 Tax=Sphaerospermopsis sp. FACHB-1194 TaxID=2692862 RepID=UPI0016811C9E|nr:hypothetical protein [Sphaerospermopsis sp. FACHB-1194]
MALILNILRGIKLHPPSKATANGNPINTREPMGNIQITWETYRQAKATPPNSTPG